MTVKERLEKAAGILQSAIVEAEPYLEGLQDYMEAAKAAERLGLTPESSQDDVLNAFAKAANDELPVYTLIPSVLSTGAPADIKKLSSEMIDTYRMIGKTIGSVAGIVAGLA